MQQEVSTLRTSEQIEINKLLTSVAEYNASDLHLSVGNIPTVRIDGELTPLGEEKAITPPETDMAAVPVSLVALVVTRCTAGYL